MIADVTIITPTIENRYSMLMECIKSVNEQEILPVNHIICTDYMRKGYFSVTERIMNIVETEFVMPLADDDLLLPHHIKDLMERSGEADLIYGYPRVEGRRRSFQRRLQQPFNEEVMRKKNIIGGCPMIRTELMREVGGYPKEGSLVLRDHELYLKFLDMGMRFSCVEKVTWVFRFHGGNMSFLRDKKHEYRI